MIRDCKAKDVDTLIAMSEEFWQHTIYRKEKFDAESCKAMIEQTMTHELCLVLEIDGKVEGFICGVKGYLLANFDIMNGTELAWWVNEDYRKSGGGLKLLRSIEKRAKKLGVKYWNMLYMQSSMPSSIKSIYESTGYRKSESFYTKVL